MSLSENVRPLLAARAPTDPNAAKLLEMFTKADEICERAPWGKHGRQFTPESKQHTIGATVHRI